MPSTLRAAMRLLTVSAMAATLAMGTGVQAQDPTPGTFCTLITAAEASTALGVAVAPTAGTDLECTYSSDPESGTYLVLTVQADTGATLQQMKDAFTDGVDLTIGGDPAWSTRDIVYVEIGGRVLEVQMDSFETDDPDYNAALIALAEIAVGRWDSLAIPEPTPKPSYAGDPELDALFPTEIGGAPVQVQSMAMRQLVSQLDPSDPDAAATITSLTDALASQGRTIDDMSIGVGFGTDAEIIGVRVKGAEVSLLQEQILPILTTGIAEPREATAQVAGKTVTVITDGPDSPEAQKMYAYARNDVLWLVVATDPNLTEIFTKLP